jgi:hypothetical protein
MQIRKKCTILQRISCKRGNNLTSAIYLCDMTTSKYKLVGLFYIVIFLNSNLHLKADEGMWLISLISKNMEQMQHLGLKLNAEDIYSINNGSLKDAVVLLDDGGCTAEIISPNGLVLTNHHCAVGDIQFHSKPENNLLRDGFWAANYDEELHIPGKTALILKRVEDVTQRVIEMISSEGVEVDFLEQVDIAIQKITEEVEHSEKGMHANVIQMFNHNQFYLFVYHRFTDIRLVGAPPSSIGNFGGDVDNWRWPRHTGDFALFRIYTSPDGEPAEYSKRNKPYKPKHHFPISLQGLNDGDFTMVIGYPGTTHRHASSFHAAHERDIVAPWVDSVWGGFIEVIKNAMQEDEGQRVHYTDTHDMLVNFWQKDTYQAKSMFRFNVVERLKQREDSLLTWGLIDSINRMANAEALKSLDEYFSHIQYNRYEELLRSINALLYWPSQVGNIINESSDLILTLLEEKVSKRQVRREAKKLAKRKTSLFENFYPQVDQRIYSIAFASFIQNLSDEEFDPLFTEIRQHEYAELLIPILIENFYNNSYFTSPEKFDVFLKKSNLDSLINDPLFMMHIRLEFFLDWVHDSLTHHKNIYQLALRDISRGLLDMNQSKLHYPDANSTMRLSYGKVLGYSPYDGIHYRPFTYLDGVMEKDDSSVEVFEVPIKLKELWEKKDFGPYTDEKGMPVCFLTDNDITNGNSGSPVLNANGHLVGVAFDGNYEAMACDFIYEPSMQRTIITDIRYVLFIIDKFAGAQHLIEELTIL